MRNIQSPTADINTPAIITSAGTVLEANTARRSWHVQNVGTNAVFVRIGGTASSTVFHYVLSAGTGDSDGLGGSCGDDGSGDVRSGLISIAGTTPKVVVTESGDA